MTNTVRRVIIRFGIYGLRRRKSHTCLKNNVATVGQPATSNPPSEVVASSVIRDEVALDNMVCESRKPLIESDLGFLAPKVGTSQISILFQDPR
jgi:hypothetical protein